MNLVNLLFFWNWFFQDRVSLYNYSSMVPNFLLPASASRELRLKVCAITALLSLLLCFSCIVSCRSSKLRGILRNIISCFISGEADLKHHVCSLRCSVVIRTVVPQSTVETSSSTWQLVKCKSLGFPGSDFQKPEGRPSNMHCNTYSRQFWQNVKFQEHTVIYY